MDEFESIWLTLMRYVILHLSALPLQEDASAMIFLPEFGF